MHVLIESASPVPGRTLLICECGILFGVIENHLLAKPEGFVLCDTLWRHRAHALSRAAAQEDAEVLMWDKGEIQTASSPPSPESSPKPSIAPPVKTSQFVQT